MRLGVVDGSDEVADGSRQDATLNDLLRGHQVAERDDAQVVADGSTEQ